MDIEKEIIAVRSKVQVEKFVRWVGSDKVRFRKLMEFFLDGKPELARKSAWIAGHCVELQPGLALPWLKHLLVMVKRPGVDNALKRNAIRILQFSKIPFSLQGAAADICFKLISSVNEPIAVRAFSLSVLEKIVQKEPGLKKELDLIVRRMLPYSTPAFSAQAKKILVKSVKKVTFETPEDEWGMIQDWLHHGREARKKIRGEKHE